MACNAPELVPTYWASVSGGKDSLYMLSLILDHPQLYPLDGVVHFRLEIDYPFIADVVAVMRSKCSQRGIPFVEISPRHTWEELYNLPTGSGSIRGFPTRGSRWCNSDYKLDAKRQLDEFMKSRGRRVYHYIGYCVDEVERIKKCKSSYERYPLVDFGIEEDLILAWASEQDIFQDFYKVNRRCGCMYCPLISRMSAAYLLVKYPENYQYMIDKMRETEAIRSKELGRPFSVIDGKPKYNADYLDRVVREKYVHKVNQILGVGVYDV